MWGSLKAKWPSGKDAFMDLITWFFYAFLFPLVQLAFIKLSNYHGAVDENVYRILFVAIASFLTTIFFVTGFWRQNRRLVRMMLLASYVISLVLFITSLAFELFGLRIFDLNVYYWGAIIALLFAFLVGFFTKYDDKEAALREIISKAKGINKSKIEEKEVEI